MIAFDKSAVPVGESNYCVFIGQRDGKEYALSHSEVLQKYGSCIRMEERMPEALSGAMGNQMYVATFSTKKAMNDFLKDVTRTK